MTSSKRCDIINKLSSESDHKEIERIKKEFEKKFNAGSLDYIRKLSVIQNSIFGVDIQPIAVEIARLRCFLSLVIEEKVYDDEPNRGINPLPNFGFLNLSLLIACLI